MTFTKIALSVLGTIGLTAGTVLAVAEPTPAPLPNAAPPSACSACKKTAPACPTGACGTARCDAAVSACVIKEASVAAEACADAKSDACEKAEGSDFDFDIMTDTIDGSVGPEGSDKTYRILLRSKCDQTREVAASECADDDAKCCDKAGRLVVGAGVESESGVTGTIVLTAGVESGECPDGECPAEKDGCRGHKVVGVDFANGLMPSLKTRTVFVKNCRRCEESCEDGSCKVGVSATACEKACEASEVAATACEVKPACAASVVKTSSCAVSACSNSDCPSATCTKSQCASCPNGKSACETDLVRNTEPAAERCEGCENCDCDSCECEAGAACDKALPSIEAGPRQPQANRHLQNYDSYRAGTVVGFEAPGRVRLTHTRPNRFSFHNDIRPFPPGFVISSGNIALSSFAVPVAAPSSQPMSTRPQDREAAEGTWTRTVGPCTVTFTCEGGRIRGTWIAGVEEGKIHFSGTCATTPDGELFGVIDMVEAEASEISTEILALTSRLTDQPFAVRLRTDGNSLIVKDFRCAGLTPDVNVVDADPNDLLERIRPIVCGRFTPAESE